MIEPGFYRTYGRWEEVWDTLVGQGFGWDHTYQNTDVFKRKFITRNTDFRYLQVREDKTFLDTITLTVL